MIWTHEHLNALDAAIALGVQRVEYHDKVVWYRSLDEMLRLRRFIIAILGHYPARTTRRYAAVSKGTR